MKIEQQAAYVESCNKAVQEGYDQMIASIGLFEYGAARKLWHMARANRENAIRDLDTFISREHLRRATRG